MNIAISNLAWKFIDEAKVLNLLKKSGISTIEIAPTKIWPDPDRVSPNTVRKYRHDLLAQGFTMVAMQSLLFGHPELTIFETNRQRDNTLRYLEKIVVLAEHLGITKLVFGSPKNRRISQLKQDYPVAINFFKRLATISAEHNVTMCLEPNPEVYGANFILNTDEALELISEVNHQCFRLNLDTGILSLNNESYQSAFRKSIVHLSHIHISAPKLSVITSSEFDHIGAGALLKELNYKGSVSIEMLEGNDISQSLAIVQNAYV